MIRDGDDRFRQRIDLPVHRHLWHSLRRSPKRRQRSGAVLRT